MRSAKQKKLYEKLMDFIGRKLIYLNQVEEWKDVELAAELGVHPQRLTEIKGYKKYNRLMSENTLIAILGGGIVTVEDILKNVETNDDEKIYIESLSVVSRKAIRMKLYAVEQALKERGIENFEGEMEELLDKLSQKDVLDKLLEGTSE